MAIKVPVAVSPVEVKVRKNKYNTDNLTNMFVEQIRVNKQSCVFYKWNTAYENPKGPTSHGLVQYQY